MPALPGMEGEVFFGSVETPLPNWRDDLPDEEDSDDISPEERKAVIGMIGFDPAEFNDKALEKSSYPTPPQVKSSALHKSLGSPSPDSLRRALNNVRDLTFQDIDNFSRQIISVSKEQANAIASVLESEGFFVEKTRPKLAEQVRRLLTELLASYQRVQFRTVPDRKPY